jgi:hypothetical protein
MSVRLLLRLEGLAIGVAAILLYADGDHSWWLFALLVLAPDISFGAYALGPAAGAAAYNLLHNLVLPLTLGCAAVLTDMEWGVAVALVWLTHIGVDRTLGYGLKYPTAFKDTHMQRV